MRVPILLSLALTALVLTGVAFAQDGLYAPSVPEDAALVRVVNATGATITFDAGPLRFIGVPPFSATAYRPLAGDVVVLFHAGSREVLTPDPRAFITIVAGTDSLFVVEDERHTDPARAQVVFYNLSRGPVDFVALQPSALLAQGVSAGGSARRVVNSVALVAGAGLGGEVLFEESVVLDRGASYSFFYLGGDTEPRGFVAEAAVVAE
ncbi:MAG: alginate O-acetyltransferase AlgF [Spirochaetota bacterium]